MTASCGQRLHGVVESHEGKSVAEAPVLALNALRIEEEHGGPVYGDGRAGRVGGKEGGGLCPPQVLERARRASLTPGDRLAHATRSLLRRPSRRPVLSVTVKAPAAIA